ncbi:MAG: dipeptidase [Acidobacteriia bacterium]|nr:dipeptidase [Terriglobia bacterium]
MHGIHSIPSIVILSAVSLACLTAQTRRASDAEVDRVHRSALLIDTHNDVTSETVKGLDIGPLRQQGHTDLVRLKQGGVGAVFFAAYVSGTYAQGNRAANRAMEMIDTIRHDIVGRHPTDFELALTADGIAAARKKGRIAALIGIEGGHAIEDSLRLLRNFHALGVRYMTLTHNNSNHWADSAGDANKPNNGLSGFGREVVREMNRLGMMVDISHASDKTFYDVLEASTVPPFASHSSCRSLANIPRNMTDAMITALGKKGGLVQINFGCEFLNQKSAETSTWANPKIAEGLRQRANAQAAGEKARAELLKKLTSEADAKMARATLEDAVAHIDRVVKLAGIDTVGIGSDYDGVGCVPVGLEDVSKFPALTRALLEKGYSPADVHKIYGGNLLRLMREAEKAAR